MRGISHAVAVDTADFAVESTLAAAVFLLNVLAVDVPPTEHGLTEAAGCGARTHKQQQHCYVSILVTQQCRRESAKKERVLISVMTRLINHYDSLVNVINIILARLTKHLIFASNHARRTSNKMPVNLNISFFGPTGSS